MTEIPLYAKLLTLACFLVSMVAAGMAVHLYSLLRTGRLGAAWRVLIIATVMFALVQTVHLAEFFGFPIFHLSSLVELAFVLTWLYAFHLQRQVFEHHAAAPLAADVEAEAEPEMEGEETAVSSYDRYS